MNIDWMIPCRYLEIHNNLATIISGGVDTFWHPELPAPIQLAVAIRVKALAEELQPDIQHEVRSIVTGPGGEVLSDLEGTVAFGVGEHVLHSDYLQGVILSATLKFEAAQEGTYQFEHIIAGSSASIPLHVVERSGPPGG